MPIPTARDRTLEHNLPTPKQIGGLLPQIEFNAEWTCALLGESWCSQKTQNGEYYCGQNCRPSVPDGTLEHPRPNQTSGNCSIPSIPVHNLLTRGNRKSLRRRRPGLNSFSRLTKNRTSLSRPNNSFPRQTSGTNC